MLLTAFHINVFTVRACDPVHGCAAFATRSGGARMTDVERALAAARVKAPPGDVVAQFSLGAMLYYGGDDTAQAIDWFRKAAAQNYAPAEFQMGQVYDFGFGVDAGRSARRSTWYRKAAEHGSAAGQRAVGDFYQKGRGVTADAAEAARWYRRGADGDDSARNISWAVVFRRHRRDPRLCVGVCLVFAGRQPGPAPGQPQGPARAAQHCGGADDPAVEEAARRVAAWKPASR